MTSPGTFPIVGVGASAGGVEALEGFFHGLPARPGLGIVIVTHLSSERESMLHEVVARYTGLPVQVAENGTMVEPDHVYVLPGDAMLSIEGGRLQIRKPPLNRRDRKPIDVFFSSLATDQGEMAVGIVLSGGDSDGTLGTKAIKERGGLTVAQVRDGYGPNHPDMPDSAISAGFIDLAIPADQMGTRLVEFAQSARLLDDYDTGEPPPPVKTLDEIRPEIYAILRNQTGHDFSGYKSRTFIRRMQRRMQVRQLAGADAYIESLRQDPQEVAALFRDLLINVTSFFRDAEAFEALERVVMPKLFENRALDDPVRVWVPGCATGEEVFTIGILLREQMDRLVAQPRVQIFATDIDERALAVARAARYPAAMLDGVSPERRQRFFVADGGSSVVSKDVRELCIFSPHSVIRDPPFSRIDLISCRNLLIYFGADIQNRVIPIFHFALKPDGYLFLGSSENVSQFDGLFEPIEQHRIFRRRSDVSAGVRLPLAMGSFRPGQQTELLPPRFALSGVALRQLADAQVLERFAPAHVLVNRDGDIVYYSPRTGKYLEASAGAPTRQLLNVARKGLRLDLRTLFREAVEGGRPVGREGISVEGDEGRIQLVNLVIEPLSQRGVEELLYLVLFVDQGPVLTNEEAAARSPAMHDDAAVQTERELRDTRERLQSMIEEYETALEELKSANEELVSVNEELQSSNEELEASKEELVSVNEELHTLNGELQNKVEALDRANSDLKNLFDSTDIAMVFLDRKLVIRSFTPAMSDVFAILPTDRGRPITDLSSKLAMPSLAADIARVAAGEGDLERHAEHSNGAAHFLVRITPYRDSDRKVNGVVITFIDITSLWHAEARQNVLIAELQHRTRNLLGITQSIAAQTFRKGPALDAFSVRLAALGRVQVLISKAKDDSIDLEELIRIELEAHGAEPAKFAVRGPKIALDPERIQSLALGLHELATNALKYGALRAPEGRLEIAWRIEPGGQQGPLLVVDWRETGLTDPPDATKHGYGRKLIEYSLAYTLRAKTELSFARDGVHCTIAMPLRPAAAQGGAPAGGQIHDDAGAA